MPASEVRSPRSRHRDEESRVSHVRRKCPRGERQGNGGRQDREINLERIRSLSNPNQALQILGPVSPQLTYLFSEHLGP